MIVKNLVDNIKSKIEGLKNVVTFYDDGTVYFSNFSETINIAKIGKKMAEILKEFNLLQALSKNENNIEFEYKYNKIIYEFEEEFVMIIKLGQNTNIALFFTSKNIKDIDISPIHRELEKMEDLIDTTDKELEGLGYQMKKRTEREKK